MTTRRGEDPVYVEPRGHSLRYRRLGEDSDETPLVFLHEGLGSIDLWRDFPANLAAAAGHPALVYSRYGHGWSDPLTDGRTSRFMHDEALEFLPNLIDDLVGEGPILIGHSDGASIALIYAGTGYAVRGLVLIAPHVMVEQPGLDKIASLKLQYETTDLAARIGTHHSDGESTFRAWSDVWLSEDFKSWNLEEFLPPIDVPILLIQSREDGYGSPKHLDIIERAVSGPVQRVLVDGDSHSPHLSHADLVTDATVNFVTSLEDHERPPA